MVRLPNYPCGIFAISLYLAGLNPMDRLNIKIHCSFSSSRGIRGGAGAAPARRHQPDHGRRRSYCRSANRAGGAVTPASTGASTPATSESRTATSGAKALARSPTPRCQLPFSPSIRIRTQNCDFPTCLSRSGSPTCLFSLQNCDFPTERPGPLL